MIPPKNNFIEKVAEMRAAQREYFKKRDNPTLNKCKAFEREVDSLLARLVSPQKELL